MFKRMGAIVIRACLPASLLWFLYAWNSSFSGNSALVVYFGRPWDVVRYLLFAPWELLTTSVYCFLAASAALILAGILATALLVVGLFSDGRLRVIERLAAVSQTIPVLVIVTISLLIEKELFAVLRMRPSADWYCLLPVTLALMFPPLANGAEGIARMPIQLKALLRIWSAPSFWRIRRIYLPCAIPDILSGVRTSATWAVGAMLITEGLLNGVEGDTNTLGHSLLRPFSSSGHPGKTLTVILIATILGFAVYHLFVILQRLIETNLQGRTAMAEEAYPLQSVFLVRDNKTQETTYALHE